jgi:DUF1009 family protein
MGSGSLGLIAGSGRFPIEAARGARRAGRRVAAIAFHEWTDPALEAEVGSVCWLHAGQVEAAVDFMRAAGVREAVMAGKVPKIALLDQAETLRLDPSAIAMLRGLQDQRDDSILQLVAGYLASRGVRLLSQLEFVPHLLARTGPLGSVKPTPDAEADIRFGWSVAKNIAGLDIGQTVVVKDRAVLAVEAIEGTDEAIRRGGSLAAGACVIKVASRDCDLRFDLPTIGHDTASALVEARINALAFEVDRTVVIDREKLVEVADEHGIALLGIQDESEPRSPQ